jgi:hypothetical protein
MIMRTDVLFLALLAASFRILNALLTLMARGIVAAIRYSYRALSKNRSLTEGREG